MVRHPVMVMAAVGLLATACSSHDHDPYVPTIRPASVSVPSTHVFSYGKRAVSNNTAVEDEIDGYVVESLTLTWPGTGGAEPRRLRARFSRSMLPGRKPLVVILPIWGLHVMPSNALTEHIRAHSKGGINVLQVLGDTTLFNWTTLGGARSEAELYRMLDRMVANFTAAIIDVRRVVDWAEARDDVDPDRIAVAGFSIGAIVASVAVAAEPRFDAGIIVMGGGDLHDALAFCEIRVGDMSKQVTQRFGWTMDQFRKNVAARLAPIEPVRYGGLVDPSRVLIVEATHDDCLSKAGRDNMWNAMGRPERIAYHYDHKTSFLSMTFLGGHDLQKRAYRFLQKTFARESRR